MSAKHKEHDTITAISTDTIQLRVLDNLILLSIVPPL
jgi:hypothetical protein